MKSERATSDELAKGAWPLHRYSVVDGGDIVGITERGGELVRLPAWTLIGEHLILGAHPADTMPPDLDVIANVDSFRFYEVPDAVLYLHFAYRDTDAIPDSTELHLAASFLNDLRAAGKTVFIHCRLGLNRSALMTGLVLVDEGYRPKDAIELMRSLRSPLVLANKTFERYLLSEPERPAGSGGVTQKVNVLDRVRRFWMPGPGPDHPLTAQEREGVPPTAIDETARLAERFVGDPFDAEARRSGLQ